MVGKVQMKKIIHWMCYLFGIKHEKIILIWRINIYKIYEVLVTKRICSLPLSFLYPASIQCKFLKKIKVGKVRRRNWIWCLFDINLYSHFRLRSVFFFKFLYLISMLFKHTQLNHHCMYYKNIIPYFRE